MESQSNQFMESQYNQTSNPTNSHDDKASNTLYLAFLATPVSAPLNLGKYFKGKRLLTMLYASGEFFWNRSLNYFYFRIYYYITTQANVFTVEHFQAEYNLFLTVAYIFPCLFTLGSRNSVP